MAIRLLTTSALGLLIAGPALADCGQQIQAIEQAVIQAETGASSAASGLPATEHQQEVLKDADAAAKTSAAGPATTEGAEQGGVPVSPHQQEVLTKGQNGQGGGDGMAKEQPAAALEEARAMAAAGDEQGCLEQVSQIKSELGLD